MMMILTSAGGIKVHISMNIIHQDAYDTLRSASDIEKMKQKLSVGVRVILKWRSQAPASV